MKNTMITMASVAALAGAANAQVVNGSFEDISFGSTLTQSGLNTLISPWTAVSGGLIAVPNADASYGNTSYGSQYLASKGPGVISQAVNLSAGAYELTFSVANYRSATTVAGNPVGYSLSNSSLASGSAATPFGAGTVGFSGGANNQMDFITHTLNFTTTGGASTLQFNMDTNVIDNISITAVPEPSSTALLGLGALGLLIRRKR